MQSKLTYETETDNADLRELTESYDPNNEAVVILTGDGEFRTFIAPFNHGRPTQ